MRALPLALAVLLAAPALAAAPAPAAPKLVEPVLFLRADPDGNRTLILLLEDDGAGPYTYTVTARPPGGVVQEVGTYVHPWTWNGLPEVTYGTYAVVQGQGTVRVPEVVLEHVASPNALAALAQPAGLEAADMALSLALFAQELALPDNGDLLPEDMGAWQAQPTVAAWHARRVLPGAEAWLGTYLARDASVQPIPGGQEGVRSTEAGVLARTPEGDTRLAGVFLEQRALATQEGSARHLASTLTAGLRSPLGRAPLLSVQGDDARSGDTGGQPEQQATTLTVGTHAQGSFAPLVGARTEVANQPSPHGTDTTRLTSVGVFVDGAYVPTAGARYHSDRHGLLNLTLAFTSGGTLGSNTTGDAELSLGTFVEGAYRPLLEASYDDRFAGAQLEHQSLVTLGAYSDLGYHPIAAASYEGTQSLVQWALRVPAGQERETAWMAAAGPFVGQAYAPLLGVRFRGDAPGANQPHEAELALGTFAVGYGGFVPLLALGASSDEAFTLMAARNLQQGPGNQGGSWQAGAGSYAAGPWTPLAQVTYAPVQDPEAPASSDMAVLLAGQPALGLQYRGEVPLLLSFGVPQSTNDDRPWRATAGTFVGGGFVPLLRVAHDANATTVTAGPDL